MHTRQTVALCAVLAVLVAASVVQADVVAMKCSSGAIFVGAPLSQAFIDAVTSSTITIYNDANQSADMVDDVWFYNVNATQRYTNHGTSPKSLNGYEALFRFDLSWLPQVRGGKVRKAEVQFYFVGGYDQPKFIRVTSRLAGRQQEGGVSWCRSDDGLEYQGPRRTVRHPISLAEAGSVSPGWR